ncbi:hypothetical protein PVK06_003221 [Gossypium arboreum]|uniref:Uncharacterized protein n=1 Tax=Gossypium arboreum TaxID=29729 RepID=A0ABR0R5Z1_GOSAR|nr:hypothetical protein PVK06_003221 [Gossypium arboreum]
MPPLMSPVSKDTVFATSQHQQEQDDQKKGTFFSVVVRCNELLLKPTRWFADSTALTDRGSPIMKEPRQLTSKIYLEYSL